MQEYLLSSSRKSPLQTRPSFRKHRLALAILAGSLSIASVQVNAQGSTHYFHGEDGLIDYVFDTRPTPGVVSSGGRIGIGYREFVEQGSTATLTVTGGGRLYARLINLGSKNDSHGTLQIENGGKVFIDNGVYYAYPLAIGGHGGSSNSNGNYEGSTGIVNITGVGSELNIAPGSGEIAIGATGAIGYLNISDGGRFIAEDGSYNYGVYIGSRGSASTKGYVTVDGKGSEFYSEGRILLGTYNQGVLTVTNGATAKTDSYISIGRVASIQGESLLSISGAGSQVSAQDIYMSEGNYNKSAIIVADDAILTVDNNIYITGTISASAELIIGAREGEDAVRAGAVNASQIQFGKSGYIGIGKIIFNHTNDDYQFGVAINERGAINVLSGNTELTADNSGFTGNFMIDSAGTLTAQQHNLSNVSIVNDGTLTLLGNSDWELANTISGNGLINADTNGNQFSFAANTGDAFTGTVVLNNTRFTLDSLNVPQNTQFLANTILQLNSGSLTTVASGAQSIGGLTFNGGKLVFDTTITPGDVMSSNWVETDANSVLDIGGTGTIQVSMPASVPNSVPTINGNKSLLEQDDEETLIMLIKANGTVSGTGGQLELVDENGNAITNAQQLDVSQNGNVVAKGTYDFQLSSGTNNDGLYVGYGLKELELLGSGSDALTLTPQANATGLASDLRAKLTGSGDLAIDAAGQTVSLSNGGNDYTGETVVRQGTLSLANNNVLGQTAHLQLAADTQVLMNSYQQSVGKLSTVADSLVNLGEGSQLTITAAQRANGENDGGLIEHNTFAGGGSLTLDSSDVTVNGSNSQYTGDVTLVNGSSLALNQVNGLGAAGKMTLTNTDDTLTLNVAETQTRTSTHQFTRSLIGQGTVSLLNSSDITFNADNSNFSGLFNVATDATLRAASEQHLGTAEIDNQGEVYLTANSDWALENDIYGNGSLYKQGAGAMTVDHDLAYTGDTTVEAGTFIVGDDIGSAGTLSGSAQVYVLANAVLGGSGSVVGQVDNAGTISALNALSGYESTAASRFTIGSLNNQGLINLAGGSVGNTLAVNGNYDGQNGSQLMLNTALGDDNSTTDMLVISGDSSGTTDLFVYNMDGAGAETQNGIQIIRVEGASDGKFKLANRAVAGAYEYLLHKNGVTDEDGHWYLRNTLEDESNGGDSNSGSETDQGKTPIYRPEAGSYIANLASAKSMFSLRLEDREGRAENSSMWLRQYGSHNRQKDASGQLRTQTNSYVVQGGGEILSHQFGEQDRFGFGVMLGYGHAASKTQSSLTNYDSKGRVDGYNAGLYATWYQDATTLNGTYIDSWLQYNWLDAEVNGEKLAVERYDINGLSASLEAGHRIWLGENREGNAYLTPQAQVIWHSYKADSLRETNGTRVKASGGDSLQTRLGMKLSLDGVHADDKAKGKLFTVYAEANWIYNSKLTGVEMNGTPMKQSGNRNVGELKLGTEGKVNQNVNLWANVAQQVGGNGYSDTSVNIGFKYRF